MFLPRSAASALAVTLVVMCARPSTGRQAGVDGPEVLLQLLRESPGRAYDQVVRNRRETIRALGRVVREDPDARGPHEHSKAWLMAVRMLGKMRAEEAVDDLIASLEDLRPGSLSPWGDPEEVKALAKIGLPAVRPLLLHIGKKEPLRARWKGTRAVYSILGQDAACLLTRHWIEVEEDAKTKALLMNALAVIERGLKGERGLKRKETDDNSAEDNTGVLREDGGKPSGPLVKGPAAVSPQADRAARRSGRPR
ncbi:MAG: hypothetical protein ACYS9X_14970 [Planctomycetota bacterium]|jgi:hypothetical protein